MASLNDPTSNLYIDCLNQDLSNKKKIFVLLSGGVDSAVTALLLKEQGYSLHAIHMQNWDSELNGENLINQDVGCRNKEDLKSVQDLCKQLNIPLTVYNFVQEYWQEVFLPFLERLSKGELSNPDIFCNAKIKFGVLLDKLVQEHGSNIIVATGHYANVIHKDGKYYLGTCNNPKKDQTYFLSHLTSEQLSKVIFPLVTFSDKTDVREYAKSRNISLWDKKDSTGICFIGKRNFKDFVSNYLEIKKGVIRDKTTNEALSEHDGLCFYALHQRYGLNIAGKDEKYYVCGKEPSTNTLLVCKKSEIPKYLHSEVSVINDLHWINESPLKGDSLFIKYKHTYKYVHVIIEEINKNTMKIKHTSMFMTTPGQFIVFYDETKTICLGSGVYISA